MRVGLFFGSFNPIHVGHISLARYVLSHAQLDEIWLMVTPQNPLKRSCELLDDQLRLQMAQLAVRTEDRLKVKDTEFTLPKPSFTANTLRVLLEQYPNYQFTLIIGSDNLQVFDRWRSTDYILNHAKLLVYPRAADDRVALCARYPKAQWLEAPLLNVSSTLIRQRLAQRQPITGLVPIEVEQFIESKELYRI